jgi:alkanesulfonate monooxygenase SsuD/methylene tetrahydromethanopterin reductase-like flavin-dependent oxidoreductase (luciferase family)
VFLSAVAQRTRHLRLCPLVYLLPIHHPIQLAEEICMLDHLSRGRFDFGVGRGANPHEIEALGRAPEDAVESYTEAFEVLQKYFSSDVLNHAGKFWTTRDMPVVLKPYQSPTPPMWYAAATPDSAPWPARNGFNIICGGPAADVRKISDRYREEFAAARPGAKAGLIGVWRYVVVAETDAEALRIAEAAWPSFRESFYKLWDRHGTKPARLNLTPDFASMMERGNGVAGSPATVRAYLARQAQDGNLNYLMGHFMFGNMPHAEAMHSVELFAQQVMPAIREASHAWL